MDIELARDAFAEVLNSVRGNRDEAGADQIQGCHPLTRVPRAVVAGIRRPAAGLLVLLLQSLGFAVYLCGQRGTAHFNVRPETLEPRIAHC